ncbi:MAG: hypothetical protein H0V12_05145 [Chloroflexi bacterium]|nr:hypothetical protein [Chloroflexota bacterium]
MKSRKIGRQASGERAPYGRCLSGKVERSNQALTGRLPEERGGRLQWRA